MRRFCSNKLEQITAVRINNQRCKTVWCEKKPAKIDVQTTQRVLSFSPGWALNKAAPWNKWVELEPPEKVSFDSNSVFLHYADCKYNVDLKTLQSVDQFGVRPQLWTAADFKDSSPSTIYSYKEMIGEDGIQLSPQTLQALTDLEKFGFILIDTGEDPKSEYAKKFVGHGANHFADCFDKRGHGRSLLEDIDISPLRSRTYPFAHIEEQIDVLYNQAFNNRMPEKPIEYTISMIDHFAIADRIRKDDPGLFHVLSTPERSLHPAIELNDSGEVIRVNPMMPPSDWYKHENAEKHRNAYIKHANFLHSEEFSIYQRMKVGHILLTDKSRIGATHPVWPYDYSQDIGRRFSSLDFERGKLKAFVEYDPSTSMESVDVKGIRRYLESQKQIGHGF